VSASVFGRFAPRLQEAIAARLGWTSLRPVQDLAGAAILDGHNAVVLAPTAGGKTEAAMFPALSLLVSQPVDGVGAIYLAPIKALLNNQADRLGTYAEMVGLRRFLWHGDVNAAARKAFVADPAELLMTTPESLEVMLASRSVSTARLFADLRIVVVDEVHALAGTDRGAHLMSVLERIAEHSRHDVLRVGLSATVGNPQAIVSWLGGTSRRAGVVIDPPKEPRPRAIAVVLEPDPFLLASQAAGLAPARRACSFARAGR
jgi:ATP-dependent Lhr-like helicase